MKNLIHLIAATLLVVTAHGAEKKMDTGDKIREARKKDRAALKAYLAPLDSNKDGSLTLKEFIANEDDKDAATKRFHEANKNGDRSLSKSEISGMLGLGAEVEKLKQAEKDKKKKKK